MAGQRDLARARGGEDRRAGGGALQRVRGVVALRALGRLHRGGAASEQDGCAGFSGRAGADEVGRSVLRKPRHRRGADLPPERALGAAARGRGVGRRGDAHHHGCRRPRGIEVDPAGRPARRLAWASLHLRQEHGRLYAHGAGAGRVHSFVRLRGGASLHRRGRQLQGRLPAQADLRGHQRRAELRGRQRGARGVGALERGPHGKGAQLRAGDVLRGHGARAAAGADQAGARGGVAAQGELRGGRGGARRRRRRPGRHRGRNRHVARPRVEADRPRRAARADLRRAGGGAGD